MLRKFHYREIVAQIVGATLTDAKYIIHSFRSSRRNTIAVVMDFSITRAVTIRCGEDGESLVIAQEELGEADLEEAGRIQVVRASDFDPASLCFSLGDVVSGATVELRGDIVKSIKIRFNKSSVFISNIGDNLDFAEDRFRQMVNEEEEEPLTIDLF